MSEPKRVTFETISTGTSKNLASNSSAKDEQAVRLELKLFEPNADSFPQFNFKKLCRVAKEKQKQGVPLPNGFINPLEEVDHDAEKLALEFERKYGNAYTGGENRSAKGAAAADKGSGYDENNGFIDDSEARALSVSSGDESDSLSETSETHENGNVVKKQKLHGKDKMNKDKKNDAVKSKEIPVNEVAKEIGNKEEKTTTVKDMLRAQRDANPLKSSSSHINKGPKSTSSATSDDSSTSDSDSSDSSSDANPSRHHSDEEDVFDQAVQNNKTASNMLNKIQVNGTATFDHIPQEADVKFLDTLNTHTRDLINRLVDIAKTVRENAFQSSLAVDLLNEIMKTHQNDSKTQNQIYSYLESVLPFSKQQIMNEVKEFAIRKCENEVRSQERNIQKDINQIMPGIMERYEVELKRVEEQRASYHGTEKPEQQFRNPRKKFPWNNSLRYSVNSLIAKYQSLYTQKQIRDQTLEQYTTSYITDKLIPMWPPGWMKLIDIQSHLMGKKDKDGKKSSSEHKSSKSSSHTVSNTTAAPLPLVTNSMKDDAVMAHHSDKKKDKSHITKESSKSTKHNINDKPTLPKTDKKQSSSDRPIPPSLMPMPTSDAFNVKSATTKPEIMVSSMSTSISLKQKPITISTNSNNSNGNAPNFNRHSESGITLPDVSYVQPTKRASDHSISQLISFAPSNHSSITSPLLQPTQSSLSQSLLADNPTTSKHSVSSKSLPSSSLKSSKSLDIANGSNNNFLHNNNNSKRMDGPAIIDLCDTDEGESSAKKPKLHKHKHSKKSKEIVGSSSGSSVTMPNTVQNMLNQIHQASSISLNPPACDEVDHNQIIQDLKELSASNSSRKSYDSILENQSEFKQHYNNYRVSSPPYDRNQDHFF